MFDLIRSIFYETRKEEEPSQNSKVIKKRPSLEQLKSQQRVIYKKKKELQIKKKELQKIESLYIYDDIDDDDMDDIDDIDDIDDAYDDINDIIERTERIKHEINEVNKKTKEAKKIRLDIQKKSNEMLASSQKKVNEILESSTNITNEIMNLSNEETQLKIKILEYTYSHEVKSNITYDKRTFTNEQKNLIWEYAEGLCEGCGCELSPFSGMPNSFEADHIIPWSKGGETTLENSQALCRDCNREKSNY